MRTKMTDKPDGQLFEFVVRRLIEARDAEIDRVIIEGDGKDRAEGLVASSGDHD